MHWAEALRVRLLLECNLRLRAHASTKRETPCASRTRAVTWWMCLQWRILASLRNLKSPQSQNHRH